LRRRAADRLGQLDLQLCLAGEGGGDDEKQQQDEHDIDQRREVDVDGFPRFATEFHALLLPSLRAAGLAGAAAAGLPPSTSRSPCTTSTNLIASCSMPTTSSSTRRCRKRWKNSAGIATNRPAAVVIRALEIPPASTAALAMLAPMKALKMSIMPSTVPSRPSSGATPAMVPRALR